jgi:2-isopropylmalate synthase
MKWREEKGGVWNVPYLPIDPKDVGREYEADVIRINSQSGKGGIGYILETRYKHVLPAKMREDFGYHVKSISDHEHRELQPQEVYEIFVRDYVNQSQRLCVDKAVWADTENGVEVTAILTVDGKPVGAHGKGNGRLDAVSNAVKEKIGMEFADLTYEEHALTGGSSSQAVTYVSIVPNHGKRVWGAGIHDDIIASSINALFSAINRSIDKEK